MIICLQYRVPCPPENNSSNNVSGYTGMGLSAGGFMDPTSGGNISSPHYPSSGMSGSPHLSSPSPHTLQQSPHYASIPTTNDLSSLLIGQSQPHISHHLGLGSHTLPTGSPTSPSPTNEFFMTDMHMPQKMRKKGRKAKPMDGGGPPQQSNKRKSREGKMQALVNCLCPLCLKCSNLPDVTSPQFDSYVIFCFLIIIVIIL